MGTTATYRPGVTMAENMSTATWNRKGADVFDSLTHRHTLILTQSWNALRLFQVFNITHPLMNAII